LLGSVLLCIVQIIDAGAIAHPPIIALAVLGARIVDLEEEFKDLAIADLARIEHQFERFRVRAMVAVGGVGQSPPV